MAIQFKNLVDVFEQRTGAVASDAYTLTVSTEQTSGATPNPGTGGLKVQYYSVSSGTTHGFGLVAGSSSSDFLTSGPMHFYTNSDLDTVSATGLAMVLDSNQRLGIGTTAPTSRLEVNGNMVFTSENNSITFGGVTSTPSLQITNSSTLSTFSRPGGSGVLKFDSYSGIEITTAGYDNIIDSSGRWGIGTATPSQKLDVNGNVIANRYYGTGNTTYYVDPNDTSQAAYLAGDIRITDAIATIKLDSTNIYPSSRIIVTKNGSESPSMGGISWNDNPGFQGSIWSQRAIGTPYAESSIKLPTSSSYNFSINTLGSDRMVIDSTGNVGIGTTNPSVALDVNDGSGIKVQNQGDVVFEANPGLGTFSLGDAAAVFGGAYITSSDSSNIDFFGDGNVRFQNEGNVGIGTTPPRTKLDINGPLAVIGGTFTSGTSGADSSASTGIVLRRGKKIFSGIPTGGNEDFYLRNLIDHDTANNINIGQTGTGLIGDISLNTGSSGNVIFRTTGSESMRINSSGNVGIGTSNPATRLDVDGSFKLSDYTSTSVTTTGSLDPNQNYQAPTQDTLADLTVDPSGNVVRGMQEGTWTFTKAQLDGTLGMTLISAPGTNKAIIVYESSWMIKYNATGAINTNQRYEIRQASNTGIGPISQLPGPKINEILSNSQTMPGGGASAYGFYSRDVPADSGGRTFKTNTATTLHKNISASLPSGVQTVSIKLRYRIYDATTF